MVVDIFFPSLMCLLVGVTTFALSGNFSEGKTAFVQGILVGNGILGLALSFVV
jgi:tRNA A37 threonylcarbamoyladenosine biosynthesis protein TsaE